MVTQKPWNKEAFFAWLLGEDGKPGAMTQAGIPHVSDLAERANMQASTISRWQGKHRPSVDKLTDIARVLNRPRREVLLVAGLLDEADLSAEHRPVSEDHEPSAEERRAIATIRASSLSKPLQDMLIKQELERLRLLREQAEAQLQQTIKNMERVQGS